MAAPRTTPALAAAALVLAAAPARAQLATFDDLPFCAPEFDIGYAPPDDYQGFRWSGISYAHGQALRNRLDAGPGYVNGVVSRPCMAYVREGGDDPGGGFGEITRATPFTFNGGYFTAAFDSLLHVEITGYKGDVAFYGYSLFTIGTSAPQFVGVNWTDVTRIRIQPGPGQIGRQVVMDNLRFNDASVVPEPATVTLLFAGLVGVAGAGVRRRRARQDPA